MTDDTSAVRMRMKRHLMSWGTGTIDPGPALAGAARDRQAPDPEQAAATVLLESPAQLEALVASGAVGPATVVFAPTGTGGAGAAAGLELIEYDGPPAVPGEEISVGDDFYLQIQDYATSAYMSVIAPTLVRIVVEDDFTAFLADADAARETGAFPEFLVSAPVQLADLPGLGGDHRRDGPALRLFVAGSGDVSTSPSGQPLGTLEDGFAHLTARWDKLNEQTARPCGVCLGAVVDDQVRVAALASRPWLGRYLGAVAGMRELQARGVAGGQVSGFGARLNGALAELADPADADDADLPLLLWSGERAYVCQPGGRTFQLNLQLGRLAEVLLATGSLERAAQHADADQLAAVAGQFANAGVPLLASGARAAR